MISRTLGPEFGGSVGILFYFANIVSSALYLAACTEGLVSNFGANGSLFQVLPVGSWWSFGYSTLINVINLAVSLLGAKLFGRTSVSVLLVHKLPFSVHKKELQDLQRDSLMNQ